MEGYYTRYSRESDREQVEKLLYDTFGIMVVYEGAYDGIPSGKYLLMFEEGTDLLVAISGLCHSDEFPGPQITWTCTRPEYRHKGLMQDLFKRFIYSTDQTLYCSCWRIGGNELVNLHTLMSLFGFEKVEVNYRVRSGMLCPIREGCPYYNDHCRCYNDVFMRKGKVE